VSKDTEAMVRIGAMTTLTWRPTRELYDSFHDAPDDDQCGLLKGQVVGSVNIDTSGPSRGRWYWSMWRDAPDVDMRFIENKGWVETEPEAKARVVAAYDELMRMARDAAQADRRP
jgi:hypothetical protein